MKRIFILAIVCISALLYACGDMDDCKIDDTINTQVLIVNNGFKTISSANLVNGIYQVHIYKAGYNKENVTVGLNEVDSILKTYNTKNNTSYQVLPSSYYTIGNSVQLNNSNISDSISVTLNTSAMQSAGIGNNYILPIAITGVSPEKMSNNNYILIQYNK